jgi:hypothetical protein
MGGTAKSIESLANAGLLWGPFLFSILFIFVVTKMAHSYYRDVNLRTSPPASQEEKSTYRVYFISSVVAGIALVFIAVAWWIYAQSKTHILDGVITGLTPNARMFAVEDGIYLQSVHKDIGSGRVVQNINFAIIRYGPFVPGQKFRLDFVPEESSNGVLGDGNPGIKLEIQYQGRAHESYRLENNDGKFNLAKF